MTNARTIGILTPVVSIGRRRLIDALGQAFNVGFEVHEFGHDRHVDAWVIEGADRQDLSRISHSQKPCYVVPRKEELVDCGSSPAVEFGTHTFLNFVLGGRTVKTDEAIHVRSLPTWIVPGAVLAAKEGAPLWVVQQEGSPHHFVSMPIPDPDEGEYSFQYLHSKRFLCLLPFILFLRALTQDDRWEPPPLRASFMFDDPNLRRSKYGFIDFAKMAQHAETNGYHAAFAMIPLDGRSIHMPTASLLRQQSSRLSLLIHGNDHVARELTCRSEEEARHIVSQALSRIGEFERQSGVQVSRVMAPPHGAISESVLKEMARQGFEAVCVSNGSLSYYNNSAKWLSTLGVGPCNVVSGISVFPRFRLSQGCESSVLLAALLHQPIIPVGHHDDVASGLELLAQLSLFINSLGPVRWASMQSISRSHYARKIDGRVLWVRMLTKRIEVSVPEGINEILVERAWSEKLMSEALTWRILGQDSAWKSQPAEEPVIVPPGKTIEIVSGVAEMPVVTEKTFRLWPLVRRDLTELRDRIAPIRREVFARLSRPAATCTTCAKGE